MSVKSSKKAWSGRRCGRNKLILWTRQLMDLKNTFKCPARWGLQYFRGVHIYGTMQVLTVACFAYVIVWTEEQSQHFRENLHGVGVESRWRLKNRSRKVHNFTININRYWTVSKLRACACVFPTESAPSIHLFTRITKLNPQVCTAVSYKRASRQRAAWQSLRHAIS